MVLELSKEAKGGQPYDSWSEIFDPNRSLLWVYVIMIIDAIFYWGCIWVVEKMEASCGSFKDRMRIKMSGGGGTVALGGGGQNYSADILAKKSNNVQGRAPDANVCVNLFSLFSVSLLVSHSNRCISHPSSLSKQAG